VTWLNNLYEENAQELNHRLKEPERTPQRGQYGEGKETKSGADRVLQREGEGELEASNIPAKYVSQNLEWLAPSPPYCFLREEDGY